MADQQDWRSLLTASERYDHIQNIQKAIDELPSGGRPTPTQSAFAIENEAYQNSASRDEYNATCTLSFSQEPAGSHELAGDDASPPHINDFAGDEDGIRLGSYQDCHYLASGVTAEVYRSGDRALKVIVEMRNIEPHNPFREAKILSELKKPCIPLLETFRDQEQRFTLVFPYMPLTLATLLERGSLTGAQLCNIFTDVFNALSHIHSQGIIHRDIKPSAFLLASPHGPVYLSDFGTAWHPRLSVSTEPANAKILDIGTGPYRAPEVLFGNKAYDSAVDMWGAGVMLAECVQRPPKPLFESRPVHEDGNQLGLILSIFKTMGSPTRETWPEAVNFKTPPFEIYQVFERKEWAEILPDVDPEWRELVSALVRYDSARATAEKALEFPCLK